jgi:hypothetical protein
VTDYAGKGGIEELRTLVSREFSCSGVEICAKRVVSKPAVKFSLHPFCEVAVNLDCLKMPERCLSRALA